MAKKKKTTKKPRPKRGGPVDDQKGVPEYELAQLRLDYGNPRLGAQAGKPTTQMQVLDALVDQFGIDDVLGSLAVNGYFSEEPMVGAWEIEKGQHVVRIAEGNRRLAACLILAGDSRARKHEKRTREYQDLQRKHGRAPVDRVPVIIHDDPAEFLSYMGVRHIAAAQPWDSYAKAAWVAQILDSSNISLEHVSEMIGDQHSTVARILEGFYFVNQLVDAAQFDPSGSYRRGRGSNPEYPFSWIYTALGFGPVRKWLGLPDRIGGVRADPVPVENLDDAGDLVAFLFGRKSKRQPPAVGDSRDISELAKVIADPNRRGLLQKGKTLSEVLDLSKPALQRISDGLIEAEDGLRAALLAISGETISEKEAQDLAEPSSRVARLAREVRAKIMKQVYREEPEDE